VHRFYRWRDALNVAHTDQEVIALMREYVRSIDPDIAGQLPPECRRALDPLADLQTAAVTLLHSELAFRGPRELAELLHEVAHTFAAASIRVSRLRTEPVLPMQE
jgi:hypothetical protein